MSKIIVGLIGTTGVGKDTVARLLGTSFENIKFAGALKEMARALLRYRGVGEDNIERMIEGDMKEAPTWALEAKSPRHAMVTLGTEWGRNLIGPDLWLNSARDRIENATGNVVITDVRFINEAAMIQALGGKLWRILRPGAYVSGHVSEIEQAMIAEDRIIMNDGTTGDLARQVQQALWSDFDRD